MSNASSSPSSSWSRICSFEDLSAQRVDVLALLVHHIVVFEQVFADGEVLRLDLLLCALDRAAHHAVLDRHALFHAEFLHQPGDSIRAERCASDRLRVRDRSARNPGSPWRPARPRSWLSMRLRLVPLGAENVQTAQPDDLVVLLVGLRS